MATKRKYNLADRRLIGLVCGIVAGISYGTNPLFAKPLTPTLVGTLLFGEPLTWKMAVGIAVCVGAVVFMILKPGVNTSAA